MHNCVSVVILCRCSVCVQDEKDKESGWKAAQYKNGDSVVSLRRDKKMRNKSKKKKSSTCRQNNSKPTTNVYVGNSTNIKILLGTRHTAHDYLTTTLVPKIHRPKKEKEKWYVSRQCLCLYLFFHVFLVNIKRSLATTHHPQVACFLASSLHSRVPQFTVRCNASRSKDCFPNRGSSKFNYPFLNNAR